MAGQLHVSTPVRPRMAVGAKAHLKHSPSVLLLVDVINPLDFPGAKTLQEPALEAARACVKLKQRMARHGQQTVYANDNYGQWRSDFQELLGDCQQRDGASGEIARLLAPGPDDLVILKPRHSAFFATPLDLLLTQMHTETLVIAGFAADICVQLTAMDANLRGHRIWVPRDCVASESDTRKSDALNYLTRVLNADTRASTKRRLPL